jgi:hypothetical protein
LRNIFNISLILTLSLNLGYAQSIKRSVINSFGSSSSNGTIFLSETFGQPSNIGTVSDGNSFIRQGFEQPVNNLISIPGCTDPSAFNYDINANTDDGLCCYVSGCIDQNSCNFDSTACIDDGSCLNTSNDFTFLGNIDGCCYYVSNITMSWTSADSLCSLSSGHMLSINSQNESESLNILLGNTPFGPNSYWLGLIDGNSSWQNGDSLVFTNYDASYSQSSGQYMFMQTNGYWDNASNDGLSQTNGAGIHAIMELCSSVTGCTDETSTNFNELATIDDGSCIDAIYGCTDPNAFNYDVNANTDDGSCNYCSNDTIISLISSCESYEWNGETYTESGIYSYPNSEVSKSVKFDGINDYVELSDLAPFDETKSFSLEVLFKWDGPNEESSNQYILFLAQNGPGNAKLAISTEGILSGGFLQCNCSDDTDQYLFTEQLQQNQWYHALYTYDVSTGDVKLYLDGILVDYGNYPFNSYYNVNNTPSRIGNYHFNILHFKGEVAYAHIANEVLTPANCPNEPSTNSIGYWLLEEGEGTIVVDQTSNNNNGQLVNGASWQSYNQLQSCQLTTINGCDSVAVLNLTITQPDTSYAEITACDSYEWNGEAYTESGEYSNTYTNVNSCDSVAVLNLTITQPDTSFTDVTACEIYEWNGQTYSESGTYEYLEQNDNNYSMSFDGQNNHIELAYLPINQTSDFSFIGYYKTDGLSSSSPEIIFSTVDSFYDIASVWLGVMNNQIIFQYFDGSTQSPYLFYGNNCDDGQWHSIALSLDNSGDLFIYLDGIQVGYEVGVQIDFDFANYFSLGHDWDPGPVASNFFAGNLDNISTWDIALSQSEIQQYISCAPKGNEEGLVGYWNFEEGEGETVIDLSGNGNDGIIYGANYSSDVPEQSCQLTTVNGCDSVAVLNLTITQPDTSYIDVTACESYEWNGQTYTESGIYTHSVSSNNELSMSFNYNNSSIQINEESTNFEELSIIGWVKLDESQTFINNQRTFIQKNNSDDQKSWVLGSYQNKLSFLLLSNGENQGLWGWSDTELNNQWTHVAATFDGSQMKLYINGELDPYVIDFEGQIDDIEDSDIYFGDFIGGGGGVGALIDNFSIWNLALSHNDVLKYMNCSPSPSDEGLVGYWNFEEGQGNAVYDLSGNENDGTNDGATYSSDVPEQSCQLQTINGCDSVAVLNLTINQPDTSFTEIIACESYEWNGQTYSESGTYQYSLFESNNNYSMSFDGVDDYVSFSGMAGVYPSFSFVTTVKLNSDNYNQSLFYIGQELTGNNTTGSIDLTIDDINYSPAQLQINLNFNHGIAGTQSFNIGDWMDIAGVFDGNNQMLYMYINGQLVSSTSTIVNNISLSQNDLHKIGAGFNGSTQSTGNFFNGSLSSLSFFNKVLSQDEIDTYKTCPPNGTESGLLSHWNFDEGQGETVIDLSGNGNDGIIYGANYNSDVPEQSCQLTNVNGCDSLAVLNLTISQPDTSITEITACDSYEWNGETYTESGEYTNTYTNINSCDSVAVLNLTITQPDTSFTEITACESYEWNGETYTESGTYTQSISSNNEFSMSFDGIDDYIDLNSLQNQFTSSNGFTFCTWFKSNWIEGGNDWENMIFSITDTEDEENILRVGITYSGDIMCQFNTSSSPGPLGLAGGVVSGNNYNDNQWHYMSIVRSPGVNQTNLDLYIDTTLIFSTSSYIDFSIAYYYLIGAEVDNDLKGDFFNGFLDQTHIWGTALSQQEIQNYMNCPPIGNEDGLVGYWNFEEGEGNTVLDLSNNGNDGIINGATYSTDTPEYSCQLTNINGCDSVAILNLTIHQPDTSITQITACDEFVWEGSVYTESGIYTQSISSNNDLSMSFDGINDLIEIPSSLTFNLQSEFTFNAWIKVPQIHNSWWGTVIGAL